MMSLVSSAAPSPEDRERADASEEREIFLADIMKESLKMILSLNSYFSYNL